MTNDFSDIRLLASRSFGGSFAPRGDHAFSLALDALTISFAEIPGDPALALVRTRLLDMDAVPRKGGLALAALEGNFFWSGTNGGTLSVGEDGALWLTERRPVSELATPDGFAACLSDFSLDAATWRERSALHE